MKVRELILAFTDELRMDAPCGHCGAPFSRHGWSVTGEEDGTLLVALQMPSCPDGSGRSYRRAPQYEGP
jgi:hypothetical protein